MTKGRSHVIHVCCWKLLASLTFVLCTTYQNWIYIAQFSFSTSFIFSIGFRNLVENGDALCWSKSTEQLYSNDHLIATAKVMHQKQKLFKQLSIWLSVHKLLQMHDFRRTQQISSRSILAQHSKYYRNCWNYYQASFKNWLTLHVDITKYILIVDNRTWKFAVM